MNDVAAHDSNRAQLGSLIGVGLRHPHYLDVLSSPEGVDFVEVHAENFFMDGGIVPHLLDEVNKVMPVSIHATSLGLGSCTPIPRRTLERLKRLIDRIDPVLFSDHAAFSWADTEGVRQHTGDLLPVAFNGDSLAALTNNIDRVQQFLGRRMLIENLSSYLTLPDNTMHEFEFLQSACDKTGAGLLLDINNMHVNLFNAGAQDAFEGVKRLLDHIDVSYVGEIHLAGAHLPNPGEMMIDDHGAAVSDSVWRAYRYALERYGAKPTLIEWDTALPEWSVLVSEADKARALATQRAAA